MPLKAILFDLDETLTMHERPFEEAYLETCLLPAMRHGLEASRIVVAQLEASRRTCDSLKSRRFLRRIGIGGRDILWGDPAGDSPDLRLLADEVPGFRRAVWGEALAACNITDAALAGEMAATFPGLMRRRIKAHPDAAPLVESLGGRYKIGLVTNGLPATQDDKLKLSGLAGMFDAVSISGEVGASKPDRAIFEDTLRELGVSPAEAVFIGDRPERDIEGARRMGIRSVWINRYGEALGPDSPRPDAEIASLSELPALL